MKLNNKQITMITDTIKELVGAGIDALAKAFLPVETDKPKTRRKNRQHRVKKDIQTNTVEI
jgi:hypothetical protein